MSNSSHSSYFKSARERLGLTQRELAERLFLSRNYIAQIEMGAREPSVRVVNSLEELLTRKLTAEQPVTANDDPDDLEIERAEHYRPKEGILVGAPLTGYAILESAPEEMKDFARRLKMGIEESQLSISELAGKVGVSMERAWSWLKAEQMPRAADLRRMASLLNVEERWLRLGESPMRHHDSSESLQQVRTIPVISWSHAGEAATYEEMPKHWHGSVATSSRDRKAFAVIVEGDCMEPKFLPGDRVVLEPHAELRNGKPVVAKLVDDAVQLRIYTKLPSGVIRLASLKPEIYPTIEYKLSDFHWIYPVRELVRSV